MDTLRYTPPGRFPPLPVSALILEEVVVVPYRPDWPILFALERDHLLEVIPPEQLGRIEHFGSTAVPGLPAKPIIDMLVEVPSLTEACQTTVPKLVSEGYHYLWRPSFGDDGPPFYAWLIKRNALGQRTHHLHLIEPGFALWERLLFRDYLRRHPRAAEEYALLKLALAASASDRVAYTQGKTDFILQIMQLARGENSAEG